MAGLIATQDINSGNNVSVVYSIAIHGGAGVISKEHTDKESYYLALKNVILSLRRFAEEGLENSSITAVEVAEFGVQLLEQEPLFNAGRGSVFTHEGTQEMEACIMDGSTMQSGAVSLISSFQHPISAAKLVMQRTAHRYMAGEGAVQLCRQFKLQEQSVEYFHTQKRREQLRLAQQQSAEQLSANNTGSADNSSSRYSNSGGKSRNFVFNDHDLMRSSPTNATDEVTGITTDKTTDETTDSASVPTVLQGEGETGTVGCVCYYKRSVAAATSTGGMTNKRSGRIGDTPLVGAGTYASNSSCAVSGTGRGEEFMRAVAAYDVAARMKYAGCTLQQAVRAALHGDDDLSSCDSSCNSSCNNSSSSSSSSSNSPKEEATERASALTSVAKAVAARSLSEGCGGFICVDGRTGELVMDFNSLGMMRGSCTATTSSNSNSSSSSGINNSINISTDAGAVRAVRAEVGIWEETVCVYDSTSPSA